MRPYLGIVAMVIGMGLLPAAASAAPPPNDHRADAQTVALPSTTDGTTVEATQEANEPSGCSGTRGTVWYRVTPGRDGRVIVGLTATAILLLAIATSFSGCGRLAVAMTEFRMLPGVFARRGRRSFLPTWAFAGVALLAFEVEAQERAAGEKAAWIRAIGPTLRTAFPEVKAIVYFDENKYENGTNYDWRLDASTASYAAWNYLINDEYLNTR